MSSLEKKMKIIRGMHESAVENTEKVWEDYDKQSRSLTDELTVFVSNEFRKVLDEIGPIKSVWVKDEKKAEVVKFTVTYNPASNKFHIKINELKTIAGEIINDFNIHCPHIYTGPLAGGFCEEVNPKIISFIKNYYIDYIECPDNECEHK